MMKTKKINLAFLLLLLTAGFMASCVKDDDFDVPDTSFDPIEIDSANVIPIDVLIAGAPAIGFQTFNDSIHYTSGYVVSSDEAGNFYQELVIQDRAENPTAGLKILLAESPLFTKYEIGRKIYVQLDGFSFGTKDGIPTLGIPDNAGKFLTTAPASFENNIKRSGVLDSIVPLPVPLSDAKNHQGILVKIDSVQFTEADKDKTFASDPGDGYDAIRHLEDCRHGGDESALLFSTSNFADFKALNLPKGSGAITGIILRDYEDENDIISINDPSAMSFGHDRCSASNPGGDDQTIVSLPFHETFESLSDNEPIDNIEGWTNQDVSGSTRVWKAQNFDGSNEYAQLTALGANGAVKTWMVTPGIDLSEANGAAQLSFDTKDGNYNGEVLSVYLSTDFDGDVSTATWTEITGAALSQGHDDYPENFTPSGDVDLSTYAGQVVYVGFKYDNSENSATTTYQVDNVSVTLENDGGNPPSGDATLAFAGGDFEDWQAFVDGLNSFGLQGYATESAGTGIDGSTSLHIATDPATTNTNDYVFTALATAVLPSDYSKITFYMKGTSDKTVSLNVYKPDGSYYKFNLGDITGDATIQNSGTNQYTGTIDTGGQWVQIKLDLSGIPDLNTTNTSSDFFALKIGKNSNYALDFDNFTIE